MKISKETIEILKNFSQINPNLAISKGNKISTITVHKHIAAEAIVEEDFPAFGIYDLGVFLGDISLFDDPDFSFKDTHVILKAGKRKSKYYFADEDLLVTAPKNIKMPKAKISFILTQEDHAFINKAAATMTLADMSVESDGKKVILSVFDKEDSTSNDISIEVAMGDGQKYKMFFKVDNLRMLPGTYNVTIGFSDNGKGALSLFENDAIDLKYYIAVEADSEL